MVCTCHDDVYLDKMCMSNTVWALLTHVPNSQSNNSQLNQKNPNQNTDHIPWLKLDSFWRGTCWCKQMRRLVGLSRDGSYENDTLGYDLPPPPFCFIHNSRAIHSGRSTKWSVFMVLLFIRNGSLDWHISMMMYVGASCFIIAFDRKVPESSS